ncbi:hypothetical protein PHMEG_00077 [Phytophthora megakarya]|uniref:Uncharacterized protein n=1 Tax=Phytophthora megakarya TaxID=4795 RepID=A0A225X3Y9_9STRA|nr:hypothetical protein PHMEG_00077 [Phytophthora megakarya]
MQLRGPKRAKDGRAMRTLPEGLPQVRLVHMDDLIAPVGKEYGLDRSIVTSIEVRHPLYIDNHGLAKAVYENYSHNPKAPMGEHIVEVLCLMYIRDHSLFKVTRRDITNLMGRFSSRLKQEKSFKTFDLVVVSSPIQEDDSSCGMVE